MPPPPENHSKPHLNIPVISLHPSNPHASTQLLSAAQTYGFVFIANDPTITHLPPSQITHLFTLAQHFFASPLPEKDSVAIASNAAGQNLGWLRRGVETLDPATQTHPDLKEAFNLAPPCPTTNQLPQPLPPSLAPHGPALAAFQNNCHHLCQLLLSHFAVALGLDRTWFTARHDRAQGPSGTVFRLLYYPQRTPTKGEGKTSASASAAADDDDDDDDGDDDDIRAGAHSDFGSLTLLFQQRGQPGLEIQTPAGEWAAVPVDPLAEEAGAGDARGGSAGGVETGEEEEPALPILVNIGDLLEDWTAGLLKSTVHRVIFPRGAAAAAGGGAGDRYSMAYFCHPLDDARLEAVPSALVQAQAQARKRGEKGEGGDGATAMRREGRAMTAREHLMERLGATYTVT